MPGRPIWPTNALMRKSYILGILIVSVCTAQNGPSPSEIEAAEAALRGDLRGTDNLEGPRQPRGTPVSGRLPVEIQPPESLADRPSGRSVSVAQLRHKPPKNAQQSVARGAKLSQAGDHRRAAEEFDRALRPGRASVPGGRLPGSGTKRAARPRVVERQRSNTPVSRFVAGAACGNQGRRSEGPSTCRAKITAHSSGSSGGSSESSSSGFRANRFSTRTISPYLKPARSSLR